MNTKGLKKIGALLVGAMVILSLTACSGNSSSESTSSSSDVQSSSEVQSSQDTKPTTITDREGKTITLPENIDQIVSMAPSITETLINLGLGDKIVAIDTYSVGIKGLSADLPTYDMMAPDTESIAALKPDIIFATGMSRADGDDPFKTVTDLGVVMTYVPSASSIDAIKEDIRFLGQVTGTADKADTIVKNMETEINDIVGKIADKSSKKNVYFEIGAAPSIYSFGTGTFLNEIIEMLGGKNILADQESWVSVSEEAIIKKNPDVIFTNVDYNEKPVDEILNRSGWDVIKAVKDKTVYEIDKNASSRPNEYVTVAIKEMASALYPDLFK